MKRSKILGTTLVFVMIVGMLGGLPGPLETAEASPVTEIWDWYDLDAIRDNLGGNYTLMNDLDSTTAGYEELASPTANDGSGWQPIGIGGDPFAGSLAGKGHEIRDLFVYRPNEYSVGLFGGVNKGVIADVGMMNVSVTGKQSVGGLVGHNYRGSVSNSYSTGNVTGERQVGGLVGNNNGSVSYSYSRGSVTGYEYVGGLVGHHVALASYPVSNCYFAGNVTATRTGVGGILGFNQGGSVRNSHYNYDEVLINGQKIVTVGALFDQDFEEWFTNGMFLDVDERLSNADGYYLIGSVSDFRELLAFGQNSSLKFRLTDDLDLIGESNFYVPYLAGDFAGDGHTISNLNIDVDIVSQVGLFGYLASGARITQLEVENVNITGGSHVGALAGCIQWATVSNCCSTGSVTGRDQWWYESVGGLVGWSRGYIVDSHSLASVTASRETGGLVGCNTHTVMNCYSSGNVTGRDSVGGLVGYSYCATLRDSHSSSSVNGLGYSIGGLVGWQYMGELSNSYATGNVNGSMCMYVGGLVGQALAGIVVGSWYDGNATGGSYVGGLVGFHAEGNINACFSSGSVNGTSSVGGLVGLNKQYEYLLREGTVENSHYNYDEVLINGRKIVTVGALFDQDFEEWFTNGMFLDVDERLSNADGYYLIGSVSDFRELLAFGQNSSLKFRLTDDLDLIGESNFYVPYLAGDFAGDGHTISNLNIDVDIVSQVGLFGYLASGARITQLEVENVNITGHDLVGSLVGQTYMGNVTDCYGIGEVTGTSLVGGLIGQNVLTTVSECHFSGCVTGYSSVGGLVGENRGGNVSSSYASGSATGNLVVGGLMGKHGGTVSNCYAAVTVTRPSGVQRHFGGFVGIMQGTAMNCYSIGSVRYANAADPTDAGFAGSVISGDYGMMGTFWDIETSGQTSTAGGATGKTTIEMQDIATFSSWSIVAVTNSSTRDPSCYWNIVDGETYPFLSWESDEIPGVQYELTISSWDGGSVTAPGEGTFTYDAGTAVNLVAEVEWCNYEFVGWTGDVDTVANVTAFSTTITMTGNYSIVAMFAPPPYVGRDGYWPVWVCSTPGGSVTTPGEGERVYEEGTVVDLVATPESSYRFVNWTGTVDTIGDVDSASTTIAMDGLKYITANFAEEVQEEPVYFADPNLESAIREELNMTDTTLYEYLYASDLQFLLELDAFGRGIVDLTGLEYATNLVKLNLAANGIDDISQLASLTKLTTLYLGFNKISNLSALAGLTKLEILDLEANQIGDISPLSDLTKLSHLLLSDNQIGNIFPLSSLTGLIQLELNGNQITHIDVFWLLPDNITLLKLGGNQIVDISPLSDLTSLTDLELRANNISAISSLAGLTNLAWLDLYDNQVRDISPLLDNVGLGEGDEVDLRYNPLTVNSLNVSIPELEERGVTVFCSTLISPEMAQAIIDYFPILYFHGDEFYFPTDFWHDDRDVLNNPDNYWADHHGDGPHELWPTVAYVHTVEGEWDGKDYLAIEYWFYYAYDFKLWLPSTIGDRGHPEGAYTHYHDWESVFVFLEKTGAEYTPEYVTFFGHGDSITFDWHPPDDHGDYPDYFYRNYLMDCIQSHLNHTGVFVALGTHATYPSVNRYGGSPYGAPEFRYNWPADLINNPEPVAIPEVWREEPEDYSRTLRNDDFEIVYIGEFYPTALGWPKYLDGQRLEIVKENPLELEWRPWPAEAPWIRHTWTDPWHLLEDKYRYYVRIESPVDALITAPDGRRVGFDFATGEVVNEIPGATYSGPGTEPQVIIIPDGLEGDYTIQLVGTTSGEYTMRTELLSIHRVIAVTASDIPVAEETVHQYAIDWDALARGEDGVTVQVDSNGDGIFERTITSDSELTDDEFILQTQTAIDIDPDTLTLKAQGKYVTAYIELPLGYNVTQIDVSTVSLNSIIPAMTRPTEIGDYDEDGTPDLMLKFDRSAVQAVVTVGEQVDVTVRGEVGGIAFEGSDTIRVIGP